MQWSRTTCPYRKVLTMSFPWDRCSDKLQNHFRLTFSLLWKHIFYRTWDQIRTVEKVRGVASIGRIVGFWSHSKENICQGAVVALSVSFVLSSKVNQGVSNTRKIPGNAEHGILLQRVSQKRLLAPQFPKRRHKVEKKRYDIWMMGENMLKWVCNEIVVDIPL